MNAESFVRIAGTHGGPLPMRALRIALLLSAACATPVAAEPAVTEMKVSLSHGIVEGRAALNVTIANRSRKLICIHTDAVRNPESGEMHVELRDSRGNALGYLEGGFIDPPMEGAVRLEPGESMRLHNFLDSQFPLVSDGIPFPEGMTARVSFHYGYCDDVWSLVAVSTWQRI